MHTFAVVTSSPGKALPPHVEQILSASTNDDLAFSSEDHIRWSSDRGDLHFAGWQAGHQHLGIGSRWYRDERGLTAFSGHPWLDAEPWGTDRSWAAQLHDVLSRPGTDLASLVDRLDGVYTVAHLTADGRGVVAADPLGVGILYQGSNADISVVSNRSALAARLLAPAGVEPRRDVEGVLSIVYANTHLDDRTGFSGVTTVPQASVVRFEPARLPRVVPGSRTPWIDPDVPIGTPVVELLGPVVQRLRGLVGAASSLPAPIQTMELTGGRDSRMVLALLLAERRHEQYRFVTWGSADLPDVVVAREIADRFDLDLRASGHPRKLRHWPGDPGADAAEPPAPQAPAVELSYADTLRRHVWLTSGSVSVWDLITGGRSPSPNLALSGQMGESLRTNYPATDGITSMADLARFVRSGGFKTDAAMLLRHPVRRRFDRLVIATMEDLLPPGGAPQDAVDGFYLATRLRRWFGASQELDNRNRLFPLYSLVAARAAFAIGASSRRREVLPFELIEATCPDLASMSFAGRGWPASLVSARPDADRYPSAPDVAPWRPPATKERFARWRTIRGRHLFTGAKGVGLTAEQRRMADIDEKIPVLLEMVDLGPSHELYEHLDYDATIRAVSSVGELFYSGRRAVHDAVTAAIWLGRADSPGPR